MTKPGLAVRTLERAAPVERLHHAPHIVRTNVQWRRVRIFATVTQLAKKPTQQIEAVLW